MTVYFTGMLCKVSMTISMLYSPSDLKVKIGLQTFSAHKFVLAARSEIWSLANMASTSELDLSGNNGFSVYNPY